MDAIHSSGARSLAVTPGSAPSGPVGGAANDPDDPIQAARLKRACQQFEALFLGLLLERAGVDGSSDLFFGGSTSGRLYRGMVDQALTEKLSEREGLGIADDMYRALAPAAGLSAPPAPLRRAAAGAYQCVANLARDLEVRPDRSSEEELPLGGGRGSQP